MHIQIFNLYEVVHRERKLVELQEL